MTTLTSQLIVSLVDRVTAPARGIAATVDRLQDAQRRNNAQMDEMRGRMVDAAAMAYAMARAVGAPVRAAADFETSMNQVAAVSGATEEQFDALRQQALELGRSTQFTASQAGDAMGYLAMASFDANEVLGAMPGTLQLAAAAQMDLASTADLVSNVLSGYQLEVSELGRVNDVLVKTFTSSNTSLHQLGEAMSYAAPVAATVGMRFEEAAAAIGVMGDAGIQGSRAGTSLNAILSGLASPTSTGEALLDQYNVQVLDAAGNMRGLSDILVDFEAAFGDVSGAVLDAEGQLMDMEEAADALIGTGEKGSAILQLFGRRGGPAFAALLAQGSGALSEFAEDLENAGGTAERIANVQMAGFNGMMKEFWSVVEGVQIAIGTALLPAMTQLGQQMIAILGPIAAFAEANPRLTATIVGVTAGLVALRVAAVAAQFAFLWMKGGAISAAILSMRTLQGAVWAAQMAFLPFAAGLRAVRTAMIGYTAAAAIAGHGGALAAMGSSMLALLNPIRLVRAALMALRVALISTGIGAVVVGIAMAGAWIWQNWSGIKEMFAGIADGIRESFPAAGAIIDGISESVSTLIGWFSDLTGPIDASAEDWRGWGQAVGQSIGEAMQWVAELPGRVVTALADGAGALLEAGGDIIRAIWDGARAMVDDLLAWFGDLPARIVEAIGSIDLSGIISWPSLPSWLGGGEAAVAANDNQPVVTAANDNGLPVAAAAERALETARELARLQAEAADRSWWQVDLGSTNREIAALSAEFESLTADLPDSAQAGMQAYVAALAAGGGAAGAEAAAIADDMLATLNVTATPEIDTSGFDQALAKVRALDGAIRSLPNASIGGTAAVAGARAAGGPIVRGRAYLVGEEGPEIITAGADGYVHDAATSRDMMQRGGGAAGSGQSGGGMVVQFGDIRIVVNGVSDPEAAAQAAYERFNRMIRDEISGLQADGEWSAA
ncbi:MAG: phage tail tape measure protein [Rhizobiaceae bacterium]